MAKLLYSKRNRVVKYGPVVTKTVASAHLAKEEAQRLKFLRKKRVFVPRVLCVWNNHILMNYVDAIPLPDLLDRWEKDLNLNNENIVNLAGSLSQWLFSFYNAVDSVNSGVILGDVNCRNFLYTEQGKICAVDFESFGNGMREQNIGEILSYLISYTPQNTPIKAELCNNFCSTVCKQLDLNHNLVQEYRSRYLETLSGRRRKRSQ